MQTEEEIERLEKFSTSLCGSIQGFEKQVEKATKLVPLLQQALRDKSLELQKLQVDHGGLTDEDCVDSSMLNSIAS